MLITQSHLAAARRDADRLLILIGTLWILASVILTLGQAAVILVYFLPVVFVIALLLAANLVRSGPGPLPLAAFLAGVVFIVAGALLDITVTIVHTPDLRLEGNPVARLLLDSGHSVGFVYGYGALAQSFYLSFLTLMWASLLRQRWAAWPACVWRSTTCRGASIPATWCSPSWRCSSIKPPGASTNSHGSERRRSGTRRERRSA